MKWCDQVQIGGLSLRSLWPKYDERKQMHVERKFSRGASLCNVTFATSNAMMVRPSDLKVLESLVETAFATDSRWISEETLSSLDYKALDRITNTILTLYEFDTERKKLLMQSFSIAPCSLKNDDCYEGLALGSAFDQILQMPEADEFIAEMLPAGLLKAES